MIKKYYVLAIVSLVMIPADPLPGDMYQQFLRRMPAGMRVAYELGLLIVVWNGAFLFVFPIGEIRNMAESAFTGTPRGTNRQRAKCVERHVGVQ